MIKTHCNTITLKQKKKMNYLKEKARYLNGKTREIIGEGMKVRLRPCKIEDDEKMDYKMV